MDKQILLFWNEFCNSLPLSERKRWLKTPYDIWDFGDDPWLANRLAKLVLQGKKTATSGLLWEEEYYHTPIPSVGGRGIILDSEGEPLCVIEYTQVDVLPFNKIDQEHIVLEGEGYKNENDWKDAHWNFFTSVCQYIEKEPNEEMPIILERFKVIYKRKNFNIKNSRRV